MEIASAGVYRFPLADARLRHESWVLDLPGEAEAVLPRGVVRDDDFGNRPERMRWTVGQAFEDLRIAVTAESNEKSAHAVAQHTQRYFGLELCGEHGLPPWHEGGLICGTSAAQPISAIRRFVDFVDGLQDAIEQVSVRRRPLTRRQSEDLLGYLPLSHEPIVRAELQRDGHLELVRARPLVRLLLDELARSSGMLLSTRWPAQRRPQLALVAHTSTGLYVANMLMDLGQPEGTLTCSVCGNVFTPRRQPRSGDAVYCQRVECQRVRQARNQAKFRQRRQEQD